MKAGVAVPGRVKMAVDVSGPLALTASEPQTLTWLARSGSKVVASVKLAVEQHQVGTVRDLEVSEQTPLRQMVEVRLMESLAEYAREHGILKLKVDRGSGREWIGQLMARVGFRDAASRASTHAPTQFYLDLYRAVRRRTGWADQQAGRDFGVAT